MNICQQKCKVYFECLQAAPNRPEFPGGFCVLVNLYKNKWQSLDILHIEYMPHGVYNEATIKRTEHTKGNTNMASAEFITKRIEGKEKELEKLNKKLQRIRKVEAQNWADPNPYYYNEYDLRCTLKDIEKANKTLNEYKAQFVAETEKAASRNVQAIIDFLNNWKERTFDFYESSVERYEEAYQAYLDKDSEYCNWRNNGGWKDPNKKEIEYAHREYCQNFREAWKWITPYVERNRNYKTNKWELVLKVKKLQKDLEQEANRKYDFIIERTNAIVGEITDASHLKVGDKGDLNGFIIGTKGTAKIQTIGAGGYNIQCFHFRTLIHEVK
jgi:hypothetical protein